MKSLATFKAGESNPCFGQFLSIFLLLSSPVFFCHVYYINKKWGWLLYNQISSEIVLCWEDGNLVNSIHSKMVLNQYSSIVLAMCSWRWNIACHIDIQTNISGHCLQTLEVLVPGLDLYLQGSHWPTRIQAVLWILSEHNLLLEHIVCQSHSEMEKYRGRQGRYN